MEGDTKMELSDLKKYVPRVLYERGRDYYERELVEGLAEVAPNRWEAVVAGSDLYDVSVNVNDSGKIRSTFCDCPFESDTLCKHEIAVCLAIRQEQKETGSARMAAPDVFQQLKTLKKAELLEILEELAHLQPQVKSFLLQKFSKEAGMDETMARRVISQSVNRASRRGFIE